MANTTISALPAASSIASGDTLVVVQGGVTKKAAVSLLPSGSGGSTVNTNPVPALHGFLGWTIDPAVADTARTPDIGHIYLVKMSWPTTQTVSNIIASITTGGSSLANTYLGIYDSTGTRLAVTADLSTSWQTSGMKTNALTSAVAVPGTAGGYIHIAYLIGAGTDTNIFYSSSYIDPVVLNMGLTSAFRSARSNNVYSSLPSTLPADFAAASSIVPFGLT